MHTKALRLHLTGNIIPCLCMTIKHHVAITGSAGNLGSLLARHMVNDDVDLNLLIHKKDVHPDFLTCPNVCVYRVDLDEPDSLLEAFKDVDTIVHFAGVLFQAAPAKFLPTTNVHYFHNLLQMAIRCKVKRVILISFPHVEGESTPQQPARGRLDAKPLSVHASTRLEEERLLLSQTAVEGVVLRCGMVYGKGILMIEAARFFSRYALLGVWRKKTMIHLISREDFVSATAAAVYSENALGIYHLGDDGVQTLQEFLISATSHWKTRRPWVMPLWMIHTAASLFECCSALTGCRSPLTRDFIKIGQASYYGDTSRMKQDLLPQLRYPTFQDGIHTL